MLVDTHCHLQSEAFDTDREDVIARALEELAWLVVVGDTAESSRAAWGLTRDRVYATAGIHPHHSNNFGQEAVEIIRALLEEPRVIALGEIGLDYHYEFSPREEQLEALDMQLGLAEQLDVPVILHCRDAEHDLAQLMERHVQRFPGGIMHCFSGDAAFAHQCLDWGYHISFSGIVTFPKADAVREAAKLVPMNRLLVETDSPYLAPKPLRGKRCEPHWVEHTARFLADLKGLTFEDFANQTTRNAEAVYRLS